jgi:formamidopyrimidine-DNA glycosylase
VLVPELPEVETIVRNLRPSLLSRRVTGFELLGPRQAIPSARTVREGILHRTIARVGRRGKFIVLTLSDGAQVVVHLRMSGRFEWDDGPGAPPPRHVRAVFTLDDGRRLLFCDARRFGRIRLVPRGDDPFGALGPEPLDRTFTPDRLAALLRARRRRLKPLLLDQGVIAGLGNIYADESLFRAGLHPLRHSHRLDHAQIARLHGAIRTVLRLAIRHNGTTFDWIYPAGRMQKRLDVYGRAGEPCRRCGGRIQRMRVGQRGTHVCPRCQPAPRGQAPRSRRQST